MKSGRDLVAEIRSLLRRRATYETILKWNPTQPRNPAGSTGGGRWAKGRALADIAPKGYREFRSAAGAADPGMERMRQQAGYTSVAPGMERTMGGAGYADILDAPTGEGFHNRPRGVNLPEIPKIVTAGGSLSPDKEHTVDVLKNGTITDSRPLGGGGANASVIVTMDDGTEAVYKPERGENWTASFCNHDINRFVTNRDFSLAEREAFAFEVDTALGLGLVPETVLREHVDETHIDVNTAGDDDGGGGGGGYDEDYAREQYEEAKEKLLEKAYEDAGEEFGQLYDQAVDEHVTDVQNRAKELQDIWDEESKDFVHETPYGSGSAIREHPVLSLGSKEQFERRGVVDEEVDPLEVLKEADVDLTAGMNREEKSRVREIIRERLEAGYRKVAEVDEDAAREDLDRDQWIEDHADTEQRLVESKMQSFDSWRKSHGFDSDASGGYDGGGSGEDRNPDAPHPQGGSFQHYHSNADGWGDISGDNGAKLAVLDYVIGTMDRHPGNLLFDNGNPVAIDNGYSMPGSNGDDNFKFRSHGVADWVGQGGDPSDELREELRATMDKTNWEALVDRHPGMDAKERKAFLGRVATMQIALQTQEGLRNLWANLKTSY